MSQSIPFRRAYIGLGSNLSSPVQQLRRAIAELAQLPETRLVRISPLYCSHPVGPAGQPDYINGVASLDTRLAPLDLLQGLQAIEQAHGRVRDAERWGPRTLDLDLLLYDDEMIDLPQLQVPHPEMVRRSFVLYPLADIAPELVLPTGQHLKELLAEISREGVEPLSSGGTPA